MTQYFFEAGHLSITTGWDDPLQGLFLTIETLDDGDDDEVLFCNLRLANPAMSLEEVIEACSHFDVSVPETILASLRKDAGLPSDAIAPGKLRAILIDPHTQSISEHSLDDEIDAWKQLCGWEVATTTRLFGCLAIANDEGLLQPDPVCFWAEGYPGPLADKVLLFGASTADGETTSCTLSLDDVQRQVHWRELVAGSLPSPELALMLALPDWLQRGQQLRLQLPDTLPQNPAGLLLLSAEHFAIASSLAETRGTDITGLVELLLLDAARNP